MAENFHAEQKFALSSQITRFAVSVPSAIAEGSGRGSERDYNRFLEFSLGSSFELVTQLLIAKSVGYANTERCTEMLQLLDEEQKMLMSFMDRLKR